MHLPILDRPLQLIISNLRRRGLRASEITRLGSRHILNCLGHIQMATHSHMLYFLQLVASYAAYYYKFCSYRDSNIACACPCFKPELGGV